MTIFGYLCTVHHPRGSVVCSNKSMLHTVIVGLPDTADLIRIQYRESGEIVDGTRRVLLSAINEYSLPRE